MLSSVKMFECVHTMMPLNAPGSLSNLYQLDEQMENCQRQCDLEDTTFNWNSELSAKSGFSRHLPRFLNTSWSILTYELMDGELIRACGQITLHEQRVQD